MSKPSTATAQKNPTQLSTRSAWAKGPPPNTSLPTSRSQSPAPSTSSHHTHSRRPSTLGQGVPIKDGVSVPRGNVGAVKQGSAVTFGSIDDVSAPISSSPSAAPPIKSEVKSFGSVPATVGHVNGKPSISSRPPLALSSTSPAPAVASSTTSSTTLSAPPSTAPSTAPPSAAPPKPRKADILKMFQNPSSVPSSQPSSDASSPSPRASNLPTQSSTQSQSAQGPSSQPSHQYPAFVPANSMRPQNSGPGGGAPRSPVYSRQMPNGSGSRPQGGPNGGPSQLPPGMSSPRLAPHPHPGQPPNMSSQPPIQSQMQSQMPVPGWPGYYYPPQPEQHYMTQYGHQWYPISQQMSQPAHSQHHPPPSGPHGPSHVGMPMSPRNHPPPLPPGTPSQPHAVPVMHAHHPPPPHSHSTSNSISGMSSPPPTPSTVAIPGSARLNANSSAFVPSRSKITVKNAEGLEVDLGAMTKSSPASTTAPSAVPSASGFRQGSPSITATPSRRPLSVRLETVEQRQKRIAEEEEKAKVKAEVEEKAKRDKEAKDREEERKRGEEEDRRKEEEKKKERALKEAEEEKERTRVQEEQERIRKEEEEKQRLRKEEEDRKAKEEEEKEQLRLAQEQERIKAEDEARIRVQEQEASQAKALALDTEPRPEDSESQPVPEDGEVLDADEGDVETPDAGQEHKEKAKEILRINTSPVSDFKKRPGPLDLSNTRNASPSLPSALATARVIDDLGSVPYPEGISSPKMELNVNAKNGKFRYDRDFLLQFMSICKEKPEMLPPLDAIGLEPTDQLSMSRGGSGRHRQSSGASVPSRQASVGLGFSAGGFGKAGASNFNMGSFAPPSKLSSDERFNLSTTGRAASVSGATLPFNRPSTMQRTASQGGPGGVPMSSNRVRSKRGEKRNDSNKVGNSQSGHGFSHGQSNMGQGISFEPVVPLQASANRWDRRVAASVDPDSPEIVDRKVKGLLNKLTMEKFDSISDQIIAWANRSEKEKDGRTLIQVIRLVFEKATDEATWSEMYARLCRKMMEQISPSVQDDGIKNTEGKPIAGGQLFRKYLLNRCQEDFERGWVAKETTAAAAATKALEDQAAKAANEKAKDGENEEVVLYSEEYYAAQKAKRQGLGLIKFIGELFKLQMLTERIMHECVKKLLGNVENPEEEEIESLCKLLSTVGAILDTPKARAHMDVYFSRMRELTKSQNVSSRMQFMLQDLLELRERKWVSRNAVAAPATIAQIHEAAAKEKAAQDKESYQRQISMSRGGSRRGGDRGDFAQVGPDGWAVAGNGPPRPPPKAGDLSKFGQISKPSSTMTFGPGSVFAGKKESKRESLSRTSSNSNMFSMLSQNAESAADASSKGVPEPLVQRKRLILQPRTKPAEEEEQEAVAPRADSESSEDETVMEAPSEMTEDEATRKIVEDSKEFFSVRNLDEAEVYFTKLPPVHHFRLVDKLANSAVESKESDAQLVSEFFSRAATKKLCTPAALEDGLSPISEAIDDIAIDAPKAFTLFAIMVKGAGFDEERQTRLGSKSAALLALLS